MLNHLLKSLQTSLIIIMVFVFIACGVKPESVVPEPVPVNDPDPLRFTELVNRYAGLDSLNAPLANALLFVGSSSIQGWKSLENDFTEHAVLNRGMGGSHMSDLIFYMNEIVYPHEPAAIFVYEGDNDIAAGKSPERVLSDYKTFVQKVISRWPEMPIYFISIKPSLARIQHLQNMASANALIKAYTQHSETQFYVDIFSPMLGEDGTPRPDIFGHDGLHMNAAGYELWTETIKKVLE